MSISALWLSTPSSSSMSPSLRFVHVHWSCSHCARAIHSCEQPINTRTQPKCAFMRPCDMPATRVVLLLIRHNVVGRFIFQLCVVRIPSTLCFYHERNATLAPVRTDRSSVRRVPCAEHKLPPKYYKFRNVRFLMQENGINSSSSIGKIYCCKLKNCILNECVNI